MLTITFNFSLSEAKSFFESAGLEVKHTEIPVVFGNKVDPIFLMMWCVTNPLTGKFEQLDVAFSRCIVKNKDRLMPDIDKVMIYNSFK